jgi:hypothetical protein
MIAKFAPAGFSDMPNEASFSEVIESVNDRYFEALAAQAESDRYDYFTLGTRLNLSHEIAHVAVICIANTIEPLRRRNVEELRIAVPVAQPDAEMPRPVLGGVDGENIFWLQYLARRGGLKDLGINAQVWQERFASKRKPPVANLAGKIATYTVIPMRLKEAD